MSDHPAVALAKRLLLAILWGEHVVVWELLSPTGRDLVLEAGSRRGLDAVQATRLRQGTSPPEERDAFLTGLLHGLRVDFSAVDLEAVTPTGEVVELSAGTVEIPLECPASFGAERWAAGSVVVSEHNEPEGSANWLVDRINPLVTRSE